MCCQCCARAQFLRYSLELPCRSEVISCFVLQSQCNVSLGCCLPELVFLTLCGVRPGCLADVHVHKSYLALTLQQRFEKRNWVLVEPCGAARVWQCHAALSRRNGNTDVLCDAVPSRLTLRPLQLPSPGHQCSRRDIFWDNTFRCLSCEGFLLSLLHF